MPDSPFTTDGCSGPRCLWRISNKFLLGALGDQPPFRWACELHDVAYWMGGTEQDKQLADEHLRTRVRHVMQYDGMWLARPFAWSTERGVAWFGGPDRNTPYRWTYGWRFDRRRRWQALTFDETAERDAMMLDRYNALLPEIAATGGDPLSKTLRHA